MENYLKYKDMEIKQLKQQNQDLNKSIKSANRAIKAGNKLIKSLDNAIKADNKYYAKLGLNDINKSK
jgi:hypothetical protein